MPIKNSFLDDNFQPIDGPVGITTGLNPPGVTNDLLTPEKADRASKLTEEKSKQLLDNLLSKRGTDLTEQEQGALTAYDNLQGLINKQEARKANSESALVSDEQLTTLPGQLANDAIALGTAAVDVGRTAVSSVARLPRLMYESGVTPDQFALHKSINDKNEKVASLTKSIGYAEKAPESQARTNLLARLDNKISEQKLTPEELALTVDRKFVNESTTVYESIERARSLGSFIDIIENTSKQAKTKVNTLNTDIALDNLGSHAEEAVADFKEGDYIGSVATVVEGMVDLATEDTSAAIQLLTEAAPHMIAMLTAGAPYLATFAIELQDNAIEAYRAEHKESPTTEEELMIGVLSAGSAVLDKVGATLSTGATKQMGRLIEASSKISSKVPGAVLTGIKRVGAPIGAVAVEGSTEAAQNILEQVSHSIRDPKIDPIPAIVEGSVGGVIGAGFASPGVVGDIASTVRPAVETAANATQGVRETVGNKLTDVSNTLQESINKNTDTLIEENSESDPESVMQRVISDGLNGLDEESRFERIKTLATLNMEAKNKANEEGTEYVDKREEIQAFVDFHKEEKLKEQTGKTTTEHIANIADDVESDTKAESLDAINTAVKEGKQLPLATLETISGSRLFKDADPKKTEAITKEIKAQKQLSEVADNIQNGAPGFKGLSEYVEDINVAIEFDDANLARESLSQLASFKTQQAGKLAGYKQAQKSLKDSPIGTSIDFDYNNGTGSAYYEKGRSDGLIKTIEKDLNSISSIESALTTKAKESIKEKVIVPTKTLTPEPINATTPQTTEASAGVVEESSKPIKETKPKTKSVLDRIKKSFSDDPIVVQDKINALNTIGSVNGKLPTVFETRRTDLINQLNNVTGLDEGGLKTLNQELRTFLTDVRKGAKAPSKPKQVITTPEVKTDSDVIVEPNSVDLKGTHSKNITNNILNETINSNSLVNPTTKKEVIGTPVKATVTSVFKSTPVTKKGLFNINHNFFSRYRDKGFTKAMVTKMGEVTKPELEILNALSDFNTSFSPMVESAISFLNKDNRILPEYTTKKGKKVLSSLDRNPIGYLVKEDSNGNRFINENVTGLMSTVMYDWLGTRATGTLFNTANDIRSLLGRDSNAKVWPDEHTELRYKGSSRIVIAETLGRQVVKQLGLTPTEDVDGNMVDRLALSIGLTMVAAAVNAEILEEHFIPKSTYTSFLKRGESSTETVGGDVPFIRLINKEDDINRAPEFITEIMDITKESTEFLDRMFGVESNNKYVTTEPVTSVDKTIGRTGQELPKVFKSALRSKQKVVWEVKKNLHEIVSVISRDTLEAIAGVRDPEGEHVSEVESTEAKNTDIGRLLDKYNVSIAKLDTEGGMFQDIFFEYKTDDNLRSRIVNNMLNPVGNKVHRHLVGARSWNTTVPALNTKEGAETRTNFKLAVAQAFGYKIDKNAPVQSELDFDALIKDKVVKKAITALRKIQEGGNPTVLREESIKAAVELGGENLHTLDALVALVSYDPLGSFETNLGIEVDGVTNGLAIGLMQAPIEDNVSELLSSVGIFLSGKEGVSYPEWASNPGNLDLYQRLVSDWISRLNGYYPNDPSLIALEGLIGAFVTQDIVQGVVKDTVTSLGRGFAKEPMMFTSYGSSIEGAVTELANDFLSKINGKLKAASKQDTPKEVIADTTNIVTDFYAVIGIPVPDGIDFTKPLEITFSGKELQLFNGFVNETYGKALEESLDNTFKDFFQFRDSVNTMTAVMYEVFITKYNQEIAKELESNGSKKLSVKKQREIFDSLKEYQPLIKSAYSENLDDSFLIIKETKARDYEDKQSQVQIDLGSEGSTNFNSMKNTISHSEYSTPGAKALTTLTQGQDAATQTKSKTSYDFLDVFDAKILAVDKVNVGTKLTNEQLWDVTTDYSVMDSAYESFKRIITLATRETSLREAALRGVNSRRSKDDKLTVNQFDKEVTALQSTITAGRQKIKETPDVRVGHFAHTGESMFTANPTENTDLDIATSVDEMFTEISALEEHLNNESGSSTTPIDFDNFNSQFDATLTANNAVSVFNAMSSFGNKTETLKHKQHLESILTGVINKVLKPIDAIEYKVSTTPEETHGAAKGKKVYINASTANRLNNNNELSLQEVQVHELVHVVLNHAIDNNFGVSRQLRKLFNTVDRGIRDIYGDEGWKIFMHKDSNNNNLIQLNEESEIKAAKARYDYIFNNTRKHIAPGVGPLTQKNRDKQFNDSLKEFVAFGLTNESFMETLAEIDTRVKRDTSNLTIQEKLESLFNKALDLINDLLGRPRPLKTDAALRSLVDQLVVTSNKQRNGALFLMDSVRDFNDDASTALYNKIIKPLVDWRIDQAKRPETVIGKISDVISTIPLAYHNTEYRSRVKQVLRAIGITEERFATKLVREIQGTKTSNLTWHTLLRQSKHLVDAARKKVATDYEKYLISTFVGERPDKDESVAITRVAYKSDLSTLSDTHSMSGLIQLLRNADVLEDTITKVKDELSVFGSNVNYYNTQAEGLGNLIAIGRDPSKMQAFNAYNIANLILDTRANKAKTVGDVAVAEEIIDRLATLYALKALPIDSKGLVANVMERENNINNQDNGMLSLLQVHKDFKEESLAKLFSGNKIQTVKGYTHETFNPRTDVKVASVADEADLLEQGYVAKEGQLLPDPKNPNQAVNRLYVLKDAVGLARLKGIVSLTGKSARGSSLLDGHVSLKSLTPKQDAIRDRDRYIRNSQLDVSRQFNGTFKFKNEATLIPIVDDKGNVSEFRYIMDESTKVELLDRDDRFEVVMGSMFGAITDKLNSREVNKKVLELAYEDFQTGFAKDPNAYVSINLNSTEAKYKEIYSLMPEDMRRDMITVWGKKDIKIRRELADLIFGYSKWSIADVGKGIPSMDRIHRVLNTAKVRHIEAIWQEVVSVAKTNIVIRTPAVLADNFVSNAILSLTKGVSLPFMVKNQALAIRALNEYQKQLQLKASLEIRLKTNANLTTPQRVTLKARINDLESDLTNNPVSEMIDEGVFQAITEDLEDSRSPYNFRDQLLTDLKLNKIANSENDLVRNAVQQSFMTEETSIFKLLMKATQYSDFIARFALHTHNVEVKGMDKDESLKDVIETFINYDVPTSMQLQYLNDMGFFMFTKFMFRIQKVIFTLLKDRPVSVGIALLTQQIFGDVPDILDLLGISLGGRAGFFLGPADTATNISGLKNVGDMVGFN